MRMVSSLNQKLNNHLPHLHLLRIWMKQPPTPSRISWVR
jgi:hypothetical protein